jgi:hypothetical protein
MKALLLALSFTVLLVPNARADYGWIPEYKKLITKAGLDVYKTDGNFDSAGALQALPSNAELQDTIIWLSGEYGIAENWALALEIPFFISSVDTASSRLLEGSGLGDITARLKWAVKPVTPIFTLEAMLKFPSGKTGGGAGELALGEGNFDAGLFLHSGHRGGKFLFTLSPGFLARFGGYSMAAAAEIAVQFLFPRGYIRAFSYGIFSFEDVAPFDSSTTVHDAAGSGGSYAKLNGSPIGFSLGAKIGLNLTKQVSLEVGGSKGILGSRYADYFKVGGDVAVEFDFFEAPKSIKAKEVPFDFEYDKY